MVNLYVFAQPNCIPTAACLYLITLQRCHTSFLAAHLQLTNPHVPQEAAQCTFQGTEMNQHSLTIQPRLAAAAKPCHARLLSHFVEKQPRDTALQLPQLHTPYLAALQGAPASAAADFDWQLMARVNLDPRICVVVCTLLVSHPLWVGLTLHSPMSRFATCLVCPRELSAYVFPFLDYRHLQCCQPSNPLATIQPIVLELAVRDILLRFFFFSSCAFSQTPVDFTTGMQQARYHVQMAVPKRARYRNERGMFRVVRRTTSSVSIKRDVFTCLLVLWLLCE